RPWRRASSQGRRQSAICVRREKFPAAIEKATQRARVSGLGRERRRVSFRLAGDSSGVRSAFNAIRNALNEERQLEQAAPNENTNKERHNPYAEVDQSLRGRLLGA